MTPDHARTIPQEALTDDAADALTADGDRCRLRPGANRHTIGVWWDAAPSSLAPGGPWVEVRVRAR